MSNITTPPPGVYYDIPFSDYLAWDAFHKSNVAPILRSPRHLKQSIEQPKSNDSMILGSLVDMLTVSPGERDNYVLLPETYINSKGKEMPFNLNSKTCRAEYDDIINEGKTPVKAEQMAAAEEIQAGIQNNPVAAQLLRDSIKQASLVWEDEETKLLCKARIDALGKNEITDLKTTRNASPDAFSRDSANFGYHIQAAMYLDGWKALHPDSDLEWNFIAAENQPPYCSAVYSLGADSIEAGRAIYKSAMARYIDMLENDPDMKKGYSECIEPFEIPRWALNKTLLDGDI